MKMHRGCASVRIALGVAAVIVGGLFLYGSYWFHNHFDAIIRLPFVLGCLTIGLFITAAGVFVLLLRDEE